MDQSHGEVSVVRQDQYATRCVVESADGNDACMNAFDERGDRRAPFGIVCGAHDAARLVHQHVDERLRHDALAVHLDALTSTVRFGSKLRDDSPVDTNAPGQNELFRLAPRGNPRASQDLLQSIHHRVCISVCAG